VLDEGGDKVLPGLFAVTDDVDARVLLLVQRQTQGILLGLGQFIALQFPGGPELFRFGQPRRLGQTAGGGRWQ